MSAILSTLLAANFAFTLDRTRPRRGRPHCGAGLHHALLGRSVSPASCSRRGCALCSGRRSFWPSSACSYWWTYAPARLVAESARGHRRGSPGPYSVVFIKSIQGQDENALDDPDGVADGLLHRAALAIRKVLVPRLRFNGLGLRGLDWLQCDSRLSVVMDVVLLRLGATARWTGRAGYARHPGHRRDRRRGFTSASGPARRMPRACC